MIGDDLIAIRLTAVGDGEKGGGSKAVRTSEEWAESGGANCRSIHSSVLRLHFELLSTIVVVLLVHSGSWSILGISSGYLHLFVDTDLGT